MALGALLAWEVRTGGSDNNGGAFNTGASGADFSQQNSAQVAIDNATITTSITTNVVTFVTGYTPSAADVGNVVNFLTGTNVTATIRVISSINVGAKTWTMDANVVTSGTTTNATANMGGALASPGAFGLYHIAGHDCWVAGGTYTVTSATANVAAGCLTLAGASSASNGQRAEGYASSRGDKGAFPVIKADGVITNFVLVTHAPGSTLENLEFDGNTRTSSRGVSAGNTTSLTVRVRCRNCKNFAFISSTGQPQFLLCEALGNQSSPAYQVGCAICCVADGNSITGFGDVSAGNRFVGCISINNSGASSDGFSLAQSGSSAHGCMTYGNGRDGVRFGATTGIQVASNCLAVSNAGNGFGTAGTADTAYMYNCGYYNNTGGNVSASITAANNIGGILLTGDPFVNAAGNNFAPAVGSPIRAAGIPAASGTYALPGLSTASYPDIGASQHADPPAGGPPGAIGMRILEVPVDSYGY